MHEERQQQWVRSPQVRPQTLALIFLAFGLAVAFTSNIAQARKIAGLTQDVASLREESHRQLADLRKAQSALLEQDLLRLDQINTQLHNSSLDEGQQAASLASRTRSELTKTIEQRHQEMIVAISDLRADLRSGSNTPANPVKPSQLSVQRTQADAPALPVIESPPAPADSLVSAEQIDAQQPASPTVQKRGFWSKLNPFRNRNRKRADDDSSVAQ